MRVHPDRNPSRGAEAAFKAVQKAYAVVSDPEKRKIYDAYGGSEEAMQAAASRAPQYRYRSAHGGAGGPMTPEEELFAFLFGGAGGSPFFRGAPAHFGRPPQRHAHQQQQHQQQQRQQGSPMAGMLQWAVFALLFFFMLFGGGGSQEPGFRFEGAGEFRHAKVSATAPIVKYFVRDAGASVSDSVLHREYYSYLRHLCSQHRSTIDALERRKYYASKQDLEAIDFELTRLKSADSNPCHRFQEYQYSFSKIYPIPSR